MGKLFTCILSLLLSFPQAGGKVVLGGKLNMGGPPAVIPADVWFNVNTSSPGTNLTTAILNASFISSQTPTFTLSPATPTTLAVGAAQTACAMRSPILVNGTLQPTTSTVQSFASNNSTGHVSFSMFLASGQGKVTTMAGCITLGPPAGGFSLFDFAILYDGSGGYTVFPQLSNGAGSNYVVRIETNPGSVTTHSANTTVTSGGTYWFMAQMNENTGTSTAAIFNYATGAQVGSTMTAPCTTGNNITQVHVGNEETGGGTGTTFIQTLLVNLSGTYPLGP